MKTGKIFWGLVLIFTAVLLVLDGVGVGLGFLDDLPVISIIIGVLCIAWAINELTHRRYYGIFFPLSIAFLFLETSISKWCGRGGENLINNWVVLLVALLLTAGFTMIFSRHGKHWDGSGHHKCRPNFSSQIKYIDASSAFSESVECNMGAVVVNFENAEAYPGGATLSVDCNMGSVTLNVPADWKVIDSMEHNMCEARVDLPGDESKILTVTGECNMGSTVSKRV